MTLGVILLLSCVKNTTSNLSVSNPIGIMTFNVENLFDTEKDAGKEDYTFLPLERKRTDRETSQYCKSIQVKKWKEECLYLDWSEEVLSQKLKNLSEAVLQVKNGKGPDVLILQEVENVAILRKWLSTGLPNAKYETVVLIEGEDARGIDVAVVSRLPLVGDPMLHKIPFQQIPKKDLKDTRGILEVTLDLPDGTDLVVYANHFPAPFHPKEYRIQAIEFLRSLQKSKPQEVLQIAAGDFNIPGDEDRKFDILTKHVSPDWILTHKQAYQGSQGSSYYPRNKSWSFLDMIWMSQSFKDGTGWEWLPNSFQLANKASGQTEDDGIPRRFEPRTGLGVSDHFPVYVEIGR